MNIQKSGVGLSSPSWITTAKVLVVLPIRQVGLKEAENLSVAKVIGRYLVCPLGGSSHLVSGL